MVVTKHYCKLLALLGWLWVSSAHAGVLPEDRADAMYHRYQGGGVSIDGPSVLVRKKVLDDLSLSANYYVDSVSSASIDVMATASPYSEERKEVSLGADYLHDKSIFSVSVTQSEENDYSAQTISLGVSQDFFGDLTNVSLGVSKGDDEVRQNGNDSFAEDVSRMNYRVSVSQVLTKNLLAGLNVEIVSDEGYLNNPYRAYRYLDADSPRGYSYATELYPDTRTSTAASIKLRYYLGALVAQSAAIYGDVRRYQDTWGISANTYSLGYTQSIAQDWLLDIRARYYQQGQADFYQDIFARANQYNYMARDKEMSAFKDWSFGIKGRYLWKFGPSNAIKSTAVTLAVDHLRFDYENFRNVLDSSAGAGQEPLYQFSANVFKAFVSVWY